MTYPHIEDLIDVLNCDLECRPASAPGIDDVLPVVTSTARFGDRLEVGFEPEALDVVEAFAAAERLCCTGLSWLVEAAPNTRLRIYASPDQLDGLESLFAGSPR